MDGTLFCNKIAAEKRILFLTVSLNYVSFFLFLCVCGRGYGCLCTVLGPSATGCIITRLLRAQAWLAGALPPLRTCRAPQGCAAPGGPVWHRPAVQQVVARCHPRGGRMGGSQACPFVAEALPVVRAAHATPETRGKKWWLVHADRIKAASCQAL